MGVLTGSHNAAVTALILVACMAAPRRAPGNQLELVETAPIETTLDEPLPDAYVVWVDMIEHARRTIDVAQFYISNGDRLEPVVRALEGAVRRGVRVRVLVEKSFVATYPDTLARLAKSGATVRELDLGTGGILHAKYFIIDDRDAFFGSQNFDWRALEHNLELGMRVRNSAVVADLAAIFALDWAHAGREPAPRMTAPTSALVASPKGLLPLGIRWDLPQLVDMIDHARTRIRIQALTYGAGTWTELEAPLVRAAQRGVRVELMLADWSKRKALIGGLQQLARVPNIEIRLVTIPPWSGGFIPFARVIHAKAMVVDGTRAWLGTSNWEREYFYESRNVGLLVDDPQIAAQIERFFVTTWASEYARRLDPDASYTPPRIE